MKGKLRRIRCGILAMLLSASLCVPAQAGGNASSEATGKYDAYLNNHKGDYEIVDLDKNGIPELIFHNESDFTNEVFSYNPKTGKKIVLKRLGMGKAYVMVVKVNKAKGYVRIPSADTEGSLYRFYKMKDGKLVKIASLEQVNGKFEKAGYKLDGKYVSKAKYNKELTRLSKGMRKLSKVKR